MACAVREVPYVPPPPLIVQTALCPAPAVPPLPQIEAAQPLDAPLNIAQILRRDDVLRRYLQGLQSTIRCYEAQTGENHE